MSSDVTSLSATSHSVVERLADVLWREVAPQDMARAAWHVLDWLGCAAAGRVSPAGHALLATYPSVQTAQTQAFVWGGLGNVLEMDDVDRRGLLHPGPVIVPALLALAQEMDREGRSVAGSALLAALVRGYEATIRLGRAVGPGHYAQWHNTGTCGAIGAAMAAAALWRLDPGQTAQALALALSQTAGLWHTRHDPRSMGKQLHTAHAAQAGVQAALLARHGFTGPLRILEGPQGFFAAMCPGAKAEAILAQPDGPWALHDVSFKPWPACRHAHAAIDAALLLKSQLQGARPERVEVVSYKDALTFCDKPNPETEIEAKFSLQHAVAVVLQRGEPQLADFTTAEIADPALVAGRARVSVAVGPDYQRAYPQHFGAEVRAFVGGREFSASVADALGDPENPLDQAALTAKAEGLMKFAGWGDAEAQALIAAVWALPQAGTSAALLRAMEVGFGGSREARPRGSAQGAPR
jgi:2-methylcitrate dehydratase PrpD